MEGRRLSAFIVLLSECGLVPFAVVDVGAQSQFVRSVPLLSIGNERKLARRQHH